MLNVPQHTLYDIRDNNTYIVRKLADGNCWMTQNLRIGSTTTTTTITSSNSDVSSNFEIPVAQNSRKDDWGAWNNPTNVTHVFSFDDLERGNLYNWYVATAGTGISSMTSASATNLTNASSSICPKGWRLPDGGQSTSKSFYTLDKASGGNGSNRTDLNRVNAFLSEPYNYLLTGVYYACVDCGVKEQNTGGRFWSRSAGPSGGLAYDFNMQSSGSFYPQNADGIASGFSVRCVAQ